MLLTRKVPKHEKALDRQIMIAHWVAMAKNLVITVATALNA